MTREVQHYYCESLLKQDSGPPLPWRLGSAMAAGDRLFVQGELIGVGASTLVNDYVRAFNRTCVDARDSRRAAYARLLPQSNNPRHLMDQLAASLGAPLTTTELQRRSPGYLVTRLLATMRMRGVSCLVIDEIGYAERNLIDFIAELLRALDPRYQAELDSSGDHVGRVGIVLVGHRPPEVIFRRAPQALMALEGNVGVLRRYTSVQQLHEALRMAGVGLDDCGAAEGDDELAEKLLKVTHGLPAHLTPLLRHIDAMAIHRRCRPDVKVLEAAMGAFKPMVAVSTIQLGADNDGVVNEAVAQQGAVPTATERTPPRTNTGGGQGKGARGPSQTIKGHLSAGGRRTRAQEIAERKYEQGVSKAEAKDLTKSKRVIL